MELFKFYSNLSTILWLGTFLLLLCRLLNVEGLFIIQANETEEKKTAATLEIFLQQMQKVKLLKSLMTPTCLQTSVFSCRLNIQVVFQPQSELTGSGGKSE